MLYNQWQGVARDRDKKAYSDLNYAGHITIHINLPFTRSRESRHVKILYWYALNVCRMLTAGVEDASTPMYKNVKALAWFMFT